MSHQRRHSIQWKLWSFIHSQSVQSFVYYICRCWWDFVVGFFHLTKDLWWLFLYKLSVDEHLMVFKNCCWMSTQCFCIYVYVNGFCMPNCTTFFRFSVLHYPHCCGVYCCWCFFFKPHINKWKCLSCISLLRSLVTTPQTQFICSLCHIPCFTFYEEKIHQLSFKGKNFILVSEKIHWIHV